MRESYTLIVSGVCYRIPKTSLLQHQYSNQQIRHNASFLHHMYTSVCSLAEDPRIAYCTQDRIFLLPVQMHFHHKLDYQWVNNSQDRLTWRRASSKVHDIVILRNFVCSLLLTQVDLHVLFLLQPQETVARSMGTKFEDSILGFNTVNSTASIC